MAKTDTCGATILWTDDDTLTCVKPADHGPPHHEAADGTTWGDLQLEANRPDPDPDPELEAARQAALEGLA